MPQLRIATFNLENLDTTTDPDEDDGAPTLTDRVEVMRPQLERVDADVLCLQEVHAQGEAPRELDALDQLLAGTRYEDYERAWTESADGDPYDERNLVVVSRFPVASAEQVDQDLGDGAPKPAYRPVTAEPPPEEAETITWERPILHAELDVGEDRPLHVLNVHLKSKVPTDIDGQQHPVHWYRWLSASGWAEGYFVSSIKRVGQALELRRLIDTIFDGDEDARIAACGDFNAGMDSVPVKAVRGPRAEVNNPALASRVMVPCGRSIPASSRYTLIHLGEGELIDHVLISRSLLEHYEGAEIHNEILADESGPYRPDTLFPESDHAPMIAELDVPWG